MCQNIFAEQRRKNMSDEVFEDEPEDKEHLGVPKEKRYLNTASYDYSVDYLYSLMSGDNPKIVLEVPFQRNQVWKDDRSSQLIESIIMNVPIPPLYFAEEEDGKWLVVDGLQRLTAIKTYFENEYKLKDLEIISELDDLKYKDLPTKPKDLLKDGLLRINVIKKDSHPDIKYDIFMRLNKGSVSLNTQELRNCLYRGSLNDMLKNIVNNEEILTAFRQKKPHNRFLDIEFIVRFLALDENLIVDDDGNASITNYGSLKSFLNDYMEKNKELKANSLKEIEEKIITTYQKVNSILADNYGLKLPNSKSTLINKAYADCIFLSFSRIPADKLIAKKSEILTERDRIVSLPEFQESVLRRTTDHENIKTRLSIWFKGFNNGLLK